MQETQILCFQDGKFQPIKSIHRHAIRWASWDRNGDTCLLVGDRGTVAVLNDKQLEQVASPTVENLRGSSQNPRKDQSLIVGNKGTVLLLEKGKLSRISVGTEANLRRVGWSPDGTHALVTGNDGTAFSWDETRITEVSGALNNLRSVSWNPNGEYALVSGNYFAQAMVPSTTLYRYKRGASALEPLKTTDKTDLIGLDWNPDGQEALAVGYEVVWQESRIFRWVNDKLKLLSLQEPGLFPTAVAWHPTGDYALIGTGSPHSKGAGDMVVLKYVRESFQRIFSSEYRISCIAWRPCGESALIVGTRRGSTFAA